MNEISLEQLDSKTKDKVIRNEFDSTITLNRDDSKGDYARLNKDGTDEWEICYVPSMDSQLIHSKNSNDFCVYGNGSVKRVDETIIETLAHFSKTQNQGLDFQELIIYETIQLIADYLLEKGVPFLVPRKDMIIARGIQYARGYFRLLHNDIRSFIVPFCDILTVVQELLDIAERTSTKEDPITTFKGLPVIVNNTDYVLTLLSDNANNAQSLYRIGAYISNFPVNMTKDVLYEELHSRGIRQLESNRKRRERIISCQTPNFEKKKGLHLLYEWIKDPDKEAIVVDTLVSSTNYLLIHVMYRDYLFKIGYIPKYALLNIRKGDFNNNTTVSANVADLIQMKMDQILEGEE